MSDQRLPDETASFPRVNVPKRSGNWRFEVAAIVQDMHYLSRWFQAQSAVSNSQALIDGIDAHLGSVQYYLSRRGIFPTSILIHLDAAQADLLRLAPISYVRSSLPSLVAQARRALDAEDLQLTTLEHLAKGASAEFTEDQRQTVIECLRGAGERVWRTQSRLHDFRNVVAATAGFLLLLAFALGVVSFLNPTLLPLCFQSSAVDGQAIVACPAAQSALIQVGSGPQGQFAPDVDDVVKLTASPADILLVEFIGLVAAALAGALTVKNIRGSQDPYSIPMALAFLKLPTGALTAMLGLVLVRAGLVPGIETLDTSAEIIAWALVFGFSQQLFTGMVDRQARSVLEQASAFPPTSGAAASPER